MLFALLSVWLKKLTLAAGFIGAVLTLIIFAGAGLPGVLMVALFFFLGVLATSWKKDKKPIGHFQSTRGPGQVIANSGVAALIGLLMIGFPDRKAVFLTMMAAAMASATADTLSSELGMVYGRRFYNITTGRPDEKGKDGVISFEGLLFGICGSAIMALLVSAETIWDIRFFLIVIGGTAGNLVDSLLGATLERRNLLSNNAVNFINTLAAALFVGVFVKK